LEGKPIRPNKKKELKGELMAWRTKVQAKVQGCSFLQFFSLFHYLKKKPLLFKFDQNGRNAMD
jgi:hypothetical protein